MIEKVDHIGIAVRSIAEARTFYEALGLAITTIEDVPVDGVRVAMIACGNTHIELLEPLHEDSPVGRFLAKRGPGVHHICFKSDDVRADGTRLRDADITVLRDEPTRGAGGCWVNFIHPKSTGGVLYEISEAPADVAAEVTTGST